jgi:flagellar biosynthesis/type III secretory pathway protein FliH
MPSEPDAMPVFHLTLPGPVAHAEVMPRDADLPAEAKELDGLRKTAFSLGYREGFASGARAAKVEADEEMARQRSAFAKEAEACLARLRQVHEAFEKLLPGHLSPLLMAAFERVLEHHHFSEKEVASEIAALLKQLPQARQIRIETAPKELESLRSRLATLGGLAPGLSPEWVANPDIVPGEFILRSDLGVVDGRKLVRMERIRMVLGSESSAPPLAKSPSTSEEDGTLVPAG